MKRYLLFTLCYILTFVLLLSACSERTEINNISLTQTEWKLKEKVLDAVQVNDRIYYTTGTELIMRNMTQNMLETLSIDTGKTITLLDTDDESLYFYNATDYTVTQISQSNYRIEKKYTVSSIEIGISYMVVTDNHIVLYGDDRAGETAYKDFFFVVSKSDGKVEKIQTRLQVGSMDYCGEDRIIMHINDDSTLNSYFVDYDLTTDDFGTQIPSGLGTISDMVYNEALKSIIYVYHDRWCDRVSVFNLEDQTARLIWFKEDNEIHAISSDLNVASWITNGTTCTAYDLNTAKESLTVATYGVTSYTMDHLMRKYAEETGILMQEVNYDNKDKLHLKVLAGDSDVDMYLLNPAFCIADYIRNHAYVDLMQYPEIVSIADSIGFTSLCVHNGEMFGIPFDIAVADSTAGKVNDNYIRMYNIDKYLMEFVDLSIPEYRDQDGVELKKTYEFVNNHLGYAGDTIPMLYGDFTYLECSYLLVNRASEHMDETIDFIEFAMKYLSDEERRNAPDYNTYEKVKWYSEVNFTEEMVQHWKHYRPEMFSKISEGFYAIQDGASIEETAAELAQRIRYMILE